MALRIVFMGTPEFAVPPLDLLIKHGYDVVGVITSVDKFGGRGKKTLLQSAVKRYAADQGLHIMQPKNLKNADFLAHLRSLRADLQVVVAFRMLPVVVWDMPPLGTMNLHGSLLPKYRGAAPINWAVMNGDRETGVTTFLLKHAIDTGDMLLQKKLPIGPDDTAGDVHDRMMLLGAETVLESVKLIESGDFETTPQDNTLVSKAPKIYHETCQIQFDQSTATVYNHIRGLSPFPTAWTSIDGLQMNVYEARPGPAYDRPAGTIVTDQKRFLHITTADGSIALQKIQLEGRKRMEIQSFLNGYEVLATCVESTS